MENEAVKQNVCNKEQWCRILYMVLFAVVLYLVMMLVALIAVVQMVFALFTAKTNDNIADFAADLSRYVYQIVAFLTYTDNRRPFPFNHWDDEFDDEEDYMSSVDDVGDAGQPGGDNRNMPDR